MTKRLLSRVHQIPHYLAAASKKSQRFLPYQVNGCMTRYSVHACSDARRKYYQLPQAIYLTILPAQIKAQKRNQGCLSSIDKRGYPRLLRLLGWSRKA